MSSGKTKIIIGCWVLTGYDIILLFDTMVVSDKDFQAIKQSGFLAGTG
jgi:hypothetical protein